MRITPPNYTQTPNDLFDHWLPHLGEVELKVLLLIMRKTFGWHKTRDKISISQLENLSGSCRKNIIIAVNSLIQKGLITKEVIGPIGRQETYYELVVIEDSNNSDQWRIATGGGGAAPLGGVANRHPQKKESKENAKEKQQQPPPSAVAVSDFIPEKEKPKIFSCLEPIEIPWHDKVEISKQYQESVVVNGIGWATHIDNPPKKCLAASIKYACSMGFSAKDIIQSTAKQKSSGISTSSSQELTQQEVAGFNKIYFRELNKILYEKGYRNLIEESNEYLLYDDPAGKKTKIYFKDISFLEQLSSFLRKKNCSPIIFSTIKCFEEDFIKQRGK